MLKYVKKAVRIIFLYSKNRSFAKQSYMKKLSLIATLLLAVLLLQECKKDTYTATASSNFYLLAVINDTTWTTDTITASINYYSAISGKVFSFTGTSLNKQIKFSAYQHAAGPTTGFPLSTYNVNDSTSTDNTRIWASYLTGHTDTLHVYSFTQQGKVYAGSGTMTVTAIDSVKKLITGTFQFTSQKANYGSDGTITSTSVNQILEGGFNNMPYTFSSN
jgi:hypothetical protein